MQIKDRIAAVPIISNLSVNQSTRFFAADFETPTIKTEFFKNLKDPKQNRINIAAFVDLDDPDNKVDLSLTVPQFIDQLFNRMKKNEVAQIFFHNLSKFDGFILIDWLRLNYNLTNEKIGKKTIKWSKLTFDRSWSFMYADGKIFKIEILDKKTKKALLFTCSFLLMSCSLAAIGKSVGQEKTETNYDLEPANKIEDYPQEYVNYLINDVIVLKRGLLMFKNQLETINLDLFKDPNKIAWNQLTAAAVSRSLIDAFGDEGLKISQLEQLKAGSYYYGGFTNFNQNYQDIITKKNLKVFDAKSHYPTQMVTKELPAGSALTNEFEEELSPFRHNYINKNVKINDYDFIAIKGTIDKPLTPWGVIKKTGKTYLDPIYINCKNENFEFKGTFYEWQQVKKFYKFKNWHLSELNHFTKTTDVFKKIINPLYKAKETQPNPLTFKIILNSLYGSIGLRSKPYNQALTNINNSFGSFPISLLKQGHEKPAAYYTTPLDFQPFTSQDLVLIETVPFETPEAPNWFNESDPEHWKQIAEPSKGCWNVWTASAITSFARAELFKTILIDPEAAVYCDTDSVFVLTSEKFDEHFEKLKGTDLGCWAEEYKDVVINKFHIVQPKMYALWSDDKLIKLGAVGVNKKWLKEIWESDHTYIKNNTTLTNAHLKTFKGLKGEYLDYLKDKTKFEKIPRWIDSTFPWIVESDKTLAKVETLRQKGKIKSGKANN